MLQLRRRIYRKAYFQPFCPTVCNIWHVPSSSYVPRCIHFSTFTAFVFIYQVNQFGVFFFFKKIWVFFYAHLAINWLVIYLRSPQYCCLFLTNGVSVSAGKTEQIRKNHEFQTIRSFDCLHCGSMHCFTSITATTSGSL